MTRWARYGRAAGGPDELTSRRLERRVMERVDAAPSRPRRGMMVAAVAALGLAAALLFSWWLRVPADAQPDEPAWVTIATSGRAQALTLPRGGTLWVGPDSRIELASAEDTGAVVRLRDGEVTLHVHSGPGLRWRVEVDGFEVEALGTRFRVRRASGAPDVSVDEGVVRLTGPGLPSDGVRIAAADPQVVAEAEPARDGARREDGEVDGSASPDPHADAMIDATIDPIAQRDPELAVTPLEGGAGPPARDRTPAWLQRFRNGIDAGDHAEAVAALPEDFPTGRERLSAAEFLDAGDALAGQRQRTRADSAYRAACKRAQAPACSVATFRRALLAARRGEPDEAIRLATRYLDEHPDGALAREVLGRRMEWRSVHGSMSAARSDARDYLARHADGPHVELARKILGGVPRDP